MSSVPGIRPHGGVLIDRELRGIAREGALERAGSLPRIELSEVNLSDVEMIATGALSPLTGFMTQDDYESVVNSMRLSNGVVWSIPITLAVDEDLTGSISEGDEVALYQPTNHVQDARGHLVATMHVQAKFTYDKEREAREVFRTTEEAHPGVARIYEQGNVLLGGPISLLNRPADQEFPEFRFDPIETRRMFADRGWRRIVGFQTRNPIHRAHEFIQKTAMEIVDGLFLNPLVGTTKSDDVSARVRMQSYQTILEAYYPADRVCMGVFPAAMRYAGPREAIFHAICRKNYGCTHFIVGRDHAGVGQYYGTYDAQLIFDEFEPQEIGITPLFFEYTFYCRRCQTIVSAKTCPHGKDDWLYLSGTQVRDMLSRGEAPPPEFTRPEVAQILIEAYQRGLPK
jgi:sulfate adenylyltransferase